MFNRKSTKSALLTSTIALMLCLSMLVGTTFAWFTDSVTSTNNIIKSGNLDVEFEYWNGNEWADVSGKADILTNLLWEPGVAEIAYLRVANKGSLALKYQLGINIVNELKGVNVAGEEFKLSDYIMFGVVDDVQENAYAGNRAGAIAAVTEPKKISAGYTKASQIEAGGNKHYFALVVYMPETVGNEANHNGVNAPQIDLGLNVAATQLTAEEDAFNNQYDADAALPVTVTETKAAGEVATIDTGKVAITIPATAEPGNYELTVANTSVTTDAEGMTTANYDIDLTKDGVSVNGNGTEFTVTVKVPIGITADSVKVLHKGVAIPSGNVTVNTVAGTVTFTTSSFSPYSIIYKVGATPDIIARTRTISLDEIIRSPKGVEVLGKNLLIDTNGNKSFGVNLGVVNLETAYQFEPVLSAEEVKSSKYKTWHADFIVSVDKDIPENSIALAGYYDAWCSFNNDKWVALTNEGLEIKAKEEIRLIDAMGGGGITVSYEELSEFGNDGVGFLCGAMELNNKLPENTTLTVELRVYKATGGSRDSETGEYITVGKYLYTFK